MTKKFLVANVTTASGRSLTGQNLQGAGVDVITYGLSSLLIKPGMETLNQMEALKSLMVWPGPVVIDLDLGFNKDRTRFEVVSHLDGRKHYFEFDQVMALIANLSPTYLLLRPSGFFLKERLIHCLSSRVNLLIAHEEDPSIFEDNTTLYLKTAPMSRLPSHTHKNVLIDSCHPAEDGLKGLVYSSEGTLDITRANFEQDFALIDQDCRCVVCSQKFTRAYFHHLLSHTPLLCQRLIIMHNYSFLKDNL